MPSLYTKLIAAYDGKAVPNRDLLANILMNDHKIQKSVKDNAARVFIESAEQLGLIKGGILCYSNDETPKESHSPQPVLEDSSAEVQSTKSPANTIPSSRWQINRTLSRKPFHVRPGKLLGLFSL